LGRRLIVFDKGPVSQGADEGPPTKLKGDALLIFKTEAASAIGGQGVDTVGTNRVTEGPHDLTSRAPDRRKRPAAGDAGVVRPQAAASVSRVLPKAII
jgi:hypothetical protein